MPTFNKSRGFKLKSGNTIPFKEMGSSPIQQGQADATLVTAAKAAAMANVPKDLSAQYNKTAEGVIAANKGKTEMLTTLAKEAPGILTAVGRGIQKGVGKFKAKSKARQDAGYRGVLGNMPADKADRASLGTKAGYEKRGKYDEEGEKAKWYEGKRSRGFDKEGNVVKGAVATRKANREARQEINKAAGDKFETEYQEKHKDRKSIADIRKMTGADGSVADKDRDYEQEYKQQKYKDKIANKKKNKEKGNGKDNGKGNDTIKLKKTDLSKGLANSNKGSGGFGTDINQY